MGKQEMDLGEVVQKEYFQALIYKVPSALLNPDIPLDTIAAPDSFFEKYLKDMLFAKVEVKLVQSFDRKKNEYWYDTILQKCPEEVTSYSSEPPSEFFENLYSSKTLFDKYNLRNGTLIFLHLPHFS